MHKFYSKECAMKFNRETRVNECKITSTSVVQTTAEIHILFNVCSVKYNNNNNDRLTAFDPGQPG